MIFIILLNYKKTGKCNLSFLFRNEISEMKQTKNWLMNTWTKDGFCAAEWDNEYIDSCKDAINDYCIDCNVGNMSGKV